MDFKRLSIIKTKILSLRYYIISLLVLLLLGYLIYFLLFMRAKDNDLEKVKFIGHGIYGIDNISYTNSFESLELAIKNEIKVVEVDFLFTSDGELVLNHLWNNNIDVSYNDFMNNKINDIYTPMDLKELLNYMKRYNDLYVVIDTKEDLYDNNKTIFDVYKKIVDEVILYDNKLLDRFIVQLYNFEDYKLLKKIYDFDNKIFSVYKFSDGFTIEKVVYYCLMNDIDSIVIPYEYINDDNINREKIKFIKSKNINIFVNTVNDYDIYNNLLDYGVDGVYTDFLK